MSCAEKGEEYEHDGVSEMIENGLVPNIEHSVAIDYGFEPVRAECAEGDREKAKGRGNSTKCDHFLCYLQRHFTLAKVLIPSCVCIPRKARRKQYANQPRGRSPPEARALVESDCIS